MEEENIIDTLLDKVLDTNPQGQSKPAENDGVETPKEIPEGTETSKQSLKTEPENKTEKTPRDVLSNDARVRQHAFKRETGKAYEKGIREGINRRNREAEDRYNNLLAECNKLKEQITELTKKERTEGLSASEERKLGNLEGKFEDLSHERDNVAKTYNDQELKSVVLDTFNGNEAWAREYETSIAPKAEQFNNLIKQNAENLSSFLNTRKGFASYPLLMTYLTAMEQKHYNVGEIVDAFDDDIHFMKEELNNFHAGLFKSKEAEKTETATKETVKIPSVVKKSPDIKTTWSIKDFI